MSLRVGNLENACLKVIKQVGRSNDTRSFEQLSVPIRNNIKTDILEISSNDSIASFKEQCFRTATRAKSEDDYMKIRNLFKDVISSIQEETSYSLRNREFKTYKFYDEAEELAETFAQPEYNRMQSDKLKSLPGYKSGNRVAGIIYSTLIKSYEDAGHYEKMIELSNKSLDVHNADKDHFRVLQRLYTKVNGYKNLNKRKEKYDALKEALKQIDFVIKHYDESCDNYRAMQKRPKSMEKLIREKAAICDELATMLAHKKRNKAIPYLKEAINCFKQLGDKDSIKCVEVKLQNLKTSKAINKLQKRGSNDIWGSKKNEMGRLLKKTNVAYSYVGGETKMYSELEKKYEKALHRKSMERN